MAFSLNDGGYETSMMVMMVTKKFYLKKVQVCSRDISCGKSFQIQRMNCIAVKTDLIEEALVAQLNSFKRTATQPPSSNNPVLLQKHNKCSDENTIPNSGK